MAGIGSFLSGAGQALRGINQWEDEDASRGYLARARETGVRQLEETDAALEDAKRTRATSAALRAATQGVAQQNQQIRAENAAARAAGGLPGTGGAPAAPPPLKAELGQTQTYQAMREAAMQAGDAAKVAEIDKALAHFKAEGMIDVARAALSGADEAALEQIINANGSFRVKPGSLKNADGILTAINAETGQPTPPLNIGKLAVMTGLVKPPEFEVKDGFAVNKRDGTSKWVGGAVKQGERIVDASGRVMVDGQRTFAPKDNFLTVKGEDGVETLVYVGGGAAPGAVGAAPQGAPAAGAVPVSTPGSLPAAPAGISAKARKEISDEVDNGYRAGMGELTGTAQVRDTAKNTANNLFDANRDPSKRMTPQLAASIGRRVAEGTLKPGQAKDDAGQVWNVVEVDGKIYPLERQPVGAPKAAAPRQGTPAQGGAAPAAEDDKILAVFNDSLKGGKSKADLEKDLAAVIGPERAKKIAARAGAPKASEPAKPKSGAEKAAAGISGEKFVQIPDPPAGGSNEELAAWEKKYGAQHEINQRIAADMGKQSNDAYQRERLAQKDKDMKAGSLKARLQARQQTE